MPDLIWAIAACARKDDERAKELIYKKLYGYVAVIVGRYVKSTHDQEELINETFIKAFKAVKTFAYADEESEKTEKLFYGWIGRIASNLSIDHLRARKRFQANDDWAEEELNSIAVSSTVELEVQDILKLLDKLPEIQRVIFNMFEVEGYSHEEIARELNIPESTSRTYLTRGKQKLRMLYKEMIA
jgi:RNA polymerase sigma factor (sigma-70 family)